MMMCRIVNWLTVVFGLSVLSSGCLTSANQSSAKVVGGEIAPSSGSALFITDQRDLMVCGAVYLGEGWALTDAGCVVSSGQAYELSWATDTSSIGDKRVPIELVLPSPKLGDSSDSLSGLALLYVDKDLEDFGVEPVSLPTGPASEDGGERLKFLGHGATTIAGEGRGSGLREIGVVTDSAASCRDSIAATFPSPDVLSPDSPILCAPQNTGGQPNGIGAGDAGSGLIRPMTTTDAAELVGIALPVTATAADTSMFIDVYHDLNWIILTKAGVQDKTAATETIAEGSCYDIGSGRNIAVNLQEQKAGNTLGIVFKSGLYERKEITVLPELAPLELQCAGADYAAQEAKVAFFVTAVLD